MTPRHIETRIPTQPVRMYKVLALTFLCITLILLGVIVFMSSKRVTITITTKETPVETTVNLNLAQAKGSLLASTSTISKTFLVTGDTEIPGKATGMMRVINNSATAQQLVATTRFVSSQNVLFRLKNSVTVPANGFIDAEVMADVEGVVGNIGPETFIIPGLNGARQKEVYGKTESAMVGGVRSLGVVSQKDIDTASAQIEQVMLDSASELFPKLSASTTKSLYKIINKNIVSSNAVGDSVSEFGLVLTATVVRVSYDASAVTAVATESLFERVVDNTEHIELASIEPVVTLGAVSLTENTADFIVVLSGVAVLNPDSSELEKNVFFGKTKDEIRRQLLTLDHVYAVDIVFRPAWMQTVPHINEHVEVIIKKVK